MVHAGCAFVAGIHPCRTSMSGSFESVRWNACVHRLDFGLYSHPRVFRAWSQNPCWLQGENPIYRRLRGESNPRLWTASPAHHRLSCSGPHSRVKSKVITSLLQTEQPSQEDWRKDLRSMPLWKGGPNTRTLPTVLLTPPASKAADMAHLCVPQNQALGICRGFVPDILVCGTHGREDLVNTTITSNAEEELIHSFGCWYVSIRNHVPQADLATSTVNLACRPYFTGEGKDGDKYPRLGSGALCLYCLLTARALKSWDASAGNLNWFTQSWGLEPTNNHEDWTWLPL